MPAQEGDFTLEPPQAGPYAGAPGGAAPAGHGGRPAGPEHAAQHPAEPAPSDPRQPTPTEAPPAQAPPAGASPAPAASGPAPVGAQPAPAGSGPASAGAQAAPAGSGPASAGASSAQAGPAGPPPAPGSAGAQPAPAGSGPASAGASPVSAGPGPAPAEAQPAQAGPAGPPPSAPASAGASPVSAGPGPAPAGAQPAPAAPGPASAGVQPVPGAVCVACRAGRVDTDGYCERCGHAQPRERDHMEQESGTAAAVSDRGLRHHRNEDAFALSTATVADGAPATVAVVCDGVSSAARPDEASAAASAAANQSLLAALPRGTHPQQAMHDAIVTAAHAVNALAAEGHGAQEHDSQRRRNAPACTFVGAVATGGLLVIGWVGDSRAYWVPDDRATPGARLTEDDSWAAQMVAAGLMNEAQAYADERAHAITGWLGADSYELEPHTASFEPEQPGVVIVCTDGLWNYAESVREMARAVPADAAGRPLHAAQVLVGHALDGGGHDNVTVAVVPFAPPSAGAGSAYTAP
ncbi:PP2C family protein-serine/threonine phosphatase [Streptomyces sp. NRRL F-5126]|uniref:PP2C family protein-serine/threonine phosphatase n=1 Tax=Streptomyces sp. NRRL F-5126 TaxID=1463857 RepID=UPI003B63E84A